MKNLGSTSSKGSDYLLMTWTNNDYVPLLIDTWQSALKASVFKHVLEGMEEAFGGSGSFYPRNSKSHAI